jgi:hypothetical protein
MTRIPWLPRGISPEANAAMDSGVTFSPHTDIQWAGLTLLRADFK